MKGITRTRGTITLSIDGKTTTVRYQNAIRRSEIIASFLPRYLEGKECFYTIRPDSLNCPRKGRYAPLKVFVSEAVQKKIVKEYIPSSSKRGMAALSRTYNIPVTEISKIIAFNKVA